LRFFIRFFNSRSARASARAQLKAEGRKIIDDEVPILEVQRSEEP